MSSDDKDEVDETLLFRLSSAASSADVAWQADLYGEASAEITRLRGALDAYESGEVPGCPQRGKEAEELRKGIEELLAEYSSGLVDADALQRLLDDVDARDSLAHLQEQAQ